MTARTTVRMTSQDYGRSIEVLRHTLPELAEPIETYTAALRQESYDNRVKLRAAEHDLAATKDALANVQKALKFALSARKVDR